MKTLLWVAYAVTHLIAILTLSFAMWAYGEGIPSILGAYLMVGLLFLAISIALLAGAVSRR